MCKYIHVKGAMCNFCATNGIELCLLSDQTFESLTIKAERMEDLCIDNS